MARIEEQPRLVGIDGDLLAADHGHDDAADEHRRADDEDPGAGAAGAAAAAGVAEAVAACELHAAGARQDRAAHDRRESPDRDEDDARDEQPRAPPLHHRRRRRHAARRVHVHRLALARVRRAPGRRIVPAVRPARSALVSAVRLAGSVRVAAAHLARSGPVARRLEDHAHRLGLFEREVLRRALAPTRHRDGVRPGSMGRLMPTIAGGTCLPSSVTRAVGAGGSRTSSTEGMRGSSAVRALSASVCADFCAADALGSSVAREASRYFSEASTSRPSFSGSAPSAAPSSARAPARWRGWPSRRRPRSRPCRRASAPPPRRCARPTWWPRPRSC